MHQILRLYHLDFGLLADLILPTFSTPVPHYKGEFNLWRFTHLILRLSCGGEFHPSRFTHLILRFYLTLLAFSILYGREFYLLLTVYYRWSLPYSPPAYLCSDLYYPSRGRGSQTTFAWTIPILTIYYSYVYLHWHQIPFIPASDYRRPISGHLRLFNLPVDPSPHLFTGWPITSSIFGRVFLSTSPLWQNPQFLAADIQTGYKSLIKWS